MVWLVILQYDIWISKTIGLLCQVDDTSGMDARMLWHPFGPESWLCCHFNSCWFLSFFLGLLLLLLLILILIFILDPFISLDWHWYHGTQHCLTLWQIEYFPGIDYSVRSRIRSYLPCSWSDLPVWPTWFLQQTCLIFFFFFWYFSCVPNWVNEHGARPKLDRQSRGFKAASPQCEPGRTLLGWTVGPMIFLSFLFFFYSFLVLLILFIFLLYFLFLFLLFLFFNCPLI